MVNKLVATALLGLCISAGAQTAPASAPPAVEQSKKEHPATSYCIYEDKKFSEGAVKSVDGQVLICMSRDGLSISQADGVQKPRDLVWELGSSFRGKSKLKQSAEVTR